MHFGVIANTDRLIYRLQEVGVKTALGYRRKLMERMMQNWLDQTIDESATLVKVQRISLRRMLFAAIANYRAPAWVQAPRRI